MGDVFDQNCQLVVPADHRSNYRSGMAISPGRVPRRRLVPFPALDPCDCRWIWVSGKRSHSGTYRNRNIAIVWLSAEVVTLLVSWIIRYTVIAKSRIST